YGTLAMGRRGYEIILLRDCTTGMESFETHETLGQTRGAVLFLEMFGHYSLTSEELIVGLPG
ncbi:MAG: cysteine hydrolase, partial [Gemmatimonadota bacterium]|nr:cysteine hydrolase [Gemmatimonadota bacterium]